MKWMLLLLAAWAAPASADTTAVYKSPLGAEMTIEIAANGNLRGTMGASGDYVLSLDGKDYFVLFTDKGPVVDRVDDVVAAMHGYMQKLIHDKKMPSFDDGPDFPAFKFVQGGQVTIQGRPGNAWYMQRGTGKPSGDPDTVISTDPDLAELGHAMARQFELSATMFGRAFGGKNPMAGMIDVLRTGTPLQFGGMELDAVDHKPIAPERFVLPATPETPDQVRVRLEASGGHIP